MRDFKKTFVFARVRFWRDSVMLTALAVSFAVAGGVHAQAPYPTKPIRLIVPYPPGAGTDFTARALGERIIEALGQQVVIDSRPGASATVGHGLVAKSAPDGSTLILAATGGMVSAPALGFPVTRDPVKDFAMIGLATYVPYSFVAFGGLPPNNNTGWWGPRRPLGTPPPIVQTLNASSTKGCSQRR
jgi:tripartite-type tricarboxylate transporter receptor subunit TctC